MFTHLFCNSPTRNRGAAVYQILMCYFTADEHCWLLDGIYQLMLVVLNYLMKMVHRLENLNVIMEIESVLETDIIVINHTCKGGL